VSTRAVHGLDQSMADWITTNREHHGHCVARQLRCPRRGDISCRGKRNHALRDQFSRKGGQCAIVTAGPPFLNSDIAALDETRLRQTSSKRVRIEAIGIAAGTSA